MFSESSAGSWAELQLPCCPSKQGELQENMLQNLLLNLPPQTVKTLQKVNVARFLAPGTQQEVRPHLRKGVHHGTHGAGEGRCQPIQA